MEQRGINCQGLILQSFFIILGTRENPTVYVNGLDVLNQHLLHWESGLCIAKQCLHWTADLCRRTPTCLGRLKTRFINGMVGLLFLFIIRTFYIHVAAKISWRRSI